MLLSLLVAVLIYFGEACVNNTEYFGTLDMALAIGSYTPQARDSCHCCALCHHNTDCKSFSFNLTTKGCTLFSKVGRYQEFSRLEQRRFNTQFFFMPFRSETNEFCRSDIDCVTPGDACRGRICTSNTTVTCRDVYRLNSNLPDHRYWGFIDGREIFLYCRMTQPFNGATLLLTADKNTGWTADNCFNRTGTWGYYPNEYWYYSIIGYADIIKNSSNQGTYDVFIIGVYNENTDVQEKKTRITARKNMTLLSSNIVKVDGYDLTTNASTQMAFPYKQPGYTANVLYSANSGNLRHEHASLIRSYHAAYWISDARPTVLMYIRE